MTYTTTIIIPAFNEEASIGLVLDKLLENLPTSVAVIVVNDFSSDQTPYILSLYPTVKVVNHSFNRGYGASLCTGVMASDTEYVIWMDADCQHRSSDVLRLNDALIRGDYDLCVGTRSAESHVPITRMLGKLTLGLFIKIFAPCRFSDINSGLRGFRRETLLPYLPLMPKRFGASTFTTFCFTQAAYNCAEVPITVDKRIGSSTVNQFKDGLRTLKLIVNVSLLYKPLRYFLIPGFLLFVIGTVYGIVSAFTQGLGIPTLAVILIISGIQISLYGLITDQICSLRRESFYK